MTRVQIYGAQHPVGDIFGPQFTFAVPAFQRPYAWTQNEARDLFQDLCDAMGEGDAPMSELSPYFLGSIVVVRDGSPESMLASIIDGQQRLTTLTILLSAVRALAGRDHADELNRHLYEAGSAYMGRSRRYRLALRTRDAAFFRQYIQDDGQDNGGPQALASLDPDELSDSQRNIRDNALLYLAELEKRPKAWRFRFAQYVLTGCLLLVVSTNDFESAYSIFSVLNNRGRDLTYSDILKAHLFGEIPEHRRDGLMALWEEIESGLGREDFEKLFRHICMIHDRRKAQGSILTQFEGYLKDYVAETGNLRWQAIGDRVIPFGQAMSVLRNATYDIGDDTRDINATLRWLNRLPNADWLPPAIEFLARQEGNPQAVLSFLRDLERLAASMIARHFNDNERIRRYALVLEAIGAGRSLAAPDSPLQLTLEEQGATAKALNGSLARLSAQDLKYVLRRLDASFSDTRQGMYENVTVEHVLPLKPPPGGLWSKWYKDASMRKQYESRAANLVLLPVGFNQKAGNNEFLKKRSIYASATEQLPWLALAAQARDAADWTPLTQDRRQVELMKHFKALWRLELSPARAEASAGV